MPAVCNLANQQMVLTKAKDKNKKNQDILYKKTKFLSFDSGGGGRDKVDILIN